MLLETLDLRTNDILIYSNNRFNFNDNFRIIFKNEKIKNPKRINYFDVCSFVKDPSPKNLIIYRLLTNVNSLDAYTTKYGYFIKVNGKIELIYFDPIYAIKDLRHLRFDLDPSRFRFKIQQVGLTSLTKKEAEPNFAEVYSFDLKATEAQNQNDKIFADAIFAFDPNYIDQEDDDVTELNITQKQQLYSEKNVEYASEKNAGTKIISEDHSNRTQTLTVPQAPDQGKVQDLREEIVGLLKQALGITEESLTKKISSDVNLEQIKNTADIEKHTEQGDSLSGQTKGLFELFKTTNKSDELTVRERDSVILKFE